MPKNKKLSESEASSSDEELQKKKPVKKASKKRKASTSDSDSGPDDRGPAKKQLPADTKKAKGNDNGASKSGPGGSWCIEGMRFLKVDEFRGKPLVSIREYYEKNGELLPGKKGISLSASQWRKLMTMQDNVNAAVDKY
uniref:RNA polymerase II transcriptional coactivator n=1 Tax=Cacopsylla melanoneura TaxID=428564 RepID=A0A8D8T4U5_9HEMI